MLASLGAEADDEGVVEEGALGDESSGKKKRKRKKKKSGLAEEMENGTGLLTTF